MHIDSESLFAHMNTVKHMLTIGGYYVFSVLNPEYQLLKIQTGTTQPVARPQCNDVIEFVNQDKNSPSVNLRHVWHEVKEYETAISDASLQLIKREDASPVSDTLKDSHTRYYKGVPLSHVYTVQKTS